MKTPAVEVLARLVNLLLDLLEKWDRRRAEEARQRIRDEADKDPAGSFAAHFGSRLPSDVPKDAPGAAEADADGNGEW